MISVDKCRKIDPATARLSDMELRQLLDDYSEIAQLAFESWIEGKNGSKNPEKVLSNKT